MAIGVVENADRAFRNIRQLENLGEFAYPFNLDPSISRQIKNYDVQNREAVFIDIRDAIVAYDNDLILIVDLDLELSPEALNRLKEEYPQFPSGLVDGPELAGFILAFEATRNFRIPRLLVLFASNISDNTNNAKMIDHLRTCRKKLKENHKNSHSRAYFATCAPLSSAVAIIASDEDDDHPVSNSIAEQHLYAPMSDNSAYQSIREAKRLWRMISGFSIPCSEACDLLCGQAAEAFDQLPGLHEPWDYRSNHDVDKLLSFLDKSIQSYPPQVIQNLSNCVSHSAGLDMSRLFAFDNNMYVKALDLYAVPCFFKVLSKNNFPLRWLNVAFRLKDPQFEAKYVDLATRGCCSPVAVFVALLILYEDQLVRVSSPSVGADSLFFDVLFLPDPETDGFTGLAELAKIVRQIDQQQYKMNNGNTCKALHCLHLANAKFAESLEDGVGLRVSVTMPVKQFRRPNTPLPTAIGSNP